MINWQLDFHSVHPLTFYSLDLNFISYLLFNCCQEIFLFSLLTSFNQLKQYCEEFKQRRILRFLKDVDILEHNLIKCFSTSFDLQILPVQKILISNMHRNWWFDFLPLIYFRPWLYPFHLIIYNWPTFSLISSFPRCKENENILFSQANCSGYQSQIELKVTHIVSFTSTFSYFY